MLLRHHGPYRSLASWSCVACEQHYSTLQTLKSNCGIGQGNGVTTSSRPSTAFDFSSAASPIESSDLNLSPTSAAPGNKPSWSTTLPTTITPQVTTLDPNWRKSFDTEIDSVIRSDHFSDKSLLEFPRTSSSQRGVSKFEAQAKGRDDRLFITEILNDKGQSSYNWRPTLQLLEQYSAIDICKNPIRRVNSHAETNSEELCPVPISRIQSRNQNDRRHARKIPTPDIWSVSTLEKHVEELAKSQYSQDEIPRIPHSKIKESHNLSDVTARFDAIFYSLAMRKFLSVKAYNIAIHFYYDHGIYSKARELFSQMEASGMKVPAETFNILLQGAASAHDLHSFNFILSKAIVRGFRPDHESWNMLLKTINSREVRARGFRAVIIRTMRERRIADDEPSKRGADRIIIQNELASHVERQGGSGDFLAYMDHHYGATWLTTSTGNKLLHEFSKRYTLPLALSLLPGLKSRGFVPDQVSLNTLLHSCLLLRQNRKAIETIEAFDYQFGLKPGKMAYETMFSLAWRSRLLNYLKIVWKSACVYGHTTFRMRRLISRSLSIKAPVLDADSISIRFTKFAGPFTVGRGQPVKADTAGRNLDDVLREPNFHHSMRFQEDILAVNNVKVQHDLGKLLRQALEVDMKWAADKFTRTASLQQMEERGVDSSLMMQEHLPLSRQHRRLLRSKEGESPRYGTYDRRPPAQSVRRILSSTLKRIPIRRIKAVIGVKQTRMKAPSPVHLRIRKIAIPPRPVSPAPSSKPPSSVPSPTTVPVLPKPSPRSTKNKRPVRPRGGKSSPALASVQTHDARVKQTHMPDTTLKKPATRPSSLFPPPQDPTIHHLKATNGLLNLNLSKNVRPLIRKHSLKSDRPDPPRVPPTPSKKRRSSKKVNSSAPIDVTRLHASLDSVLDQSQKV